MPSSPAIIVKKRASLCFEKAELTWLAGRVAGWEGRVSANIARKVYGGDWVDGKLTLTADALHFEPGRITRMALKDGDRFERMIALCDISSISRRWHMLQHLVDLHLSNEETVSLRMEGATAFAATLQSRIGTPRPEQPA